MLRIAPLAIVFAAWLVGEAVVRVTLAPVSGGVVGLALLLLVLGRGWLPLDAVQPGADWLLGRMTLFFVPAVLALIDHRELFGVTGLKILAVILGSTAAVMVVSGLVAQRMVSRGDAP